MRSRVSVLGWALVALSGGLWGALLGRVVFELIPLWFSWRCSSALVFGLACAIFAPPVIRYASRREPPARLVERSWPLGLGLGYLVQPAVAPLWGGAVLVASLGGVLWLARARAAAVALEQSKPPGSVFYGGHSLLGEGKARSSSGERGEWAWDLLIFGTALVVYVATLSPSVLPGDSGEFQLVAPTLGIPHPTGYPLYVVLGKLLTWVPLGSVAYRVNLLSAIAAATAVWAIYRAGMTLALRRPAALLGAGLLLVSDTLWSQAVIAEKYALHAAFVGATLWLGLRWRAACRAGQRDRGWLTAWALVYGLSLTHHRTMLLLAPAYLALIWFTDRDSLRPALIWRPLLAGLLPLLLYALLPLFSALDPPYAFVRIDSLRAFLDLVLARAYQSGLFRSGGSVRGLTVMLSGRAATFAPPLVGQFGPFGLALALVGWALLLRRQRLAAWVILGGVVAQLGFALNYDVPNAPIYCLPAYVWLAPCAAAAVDAVLRRLERPLPFPARLGSVQPHLSLVWLLLVATLPVSLCADRWQGMDQRRGYAAYAFGHAYEQLALTSVEPGALLVSDWLPATTLWYGQWVEGRAPGVQVLSVDSLEWQWRDPVQAALAAGRPVYLSRPVVEAGVQYALASAGPLVRVLPTVETTPSRTAISIDPKPGGEVELIGYDWRAVRPGPEGELYTPQQGKLEGGSALEVTLFWRARDVPSADYAVTLGIADADGRLCVQRQNRHPVGGTYPTTRWQPGQVVADAYRLDLPPALPSGRYQLVATMGPPGAGPGSSDDKDVDRLLLGEIEVAKPLHWAYASLSVSVRARCGSDLVLLGHDAPPQVTAGETVNVAVQWLVTGDDAGNDVPALYAVQIDGSARQAVTWRNNPADWRRGAIVVAQYTVDAGDALDHLELRGDGWAYRLPTRLGVSRAIVADLQVIRLRDYRYASQELHPGERVRLTLDWEAMADIDERYKVFVHVLGQNGLPVAQQDNEPVNGTHPTTRWRRGDRISDTYAFTLPEALAPGTYEVEVGLYRISDLTRLPVLDETGAAIDDKVYLAPITVE